MGGQSSQQNQQTQQSTTNPWAQATPALTGILSQLQGLTPNASLTPTQDNALGTMTNNANFYGSAFTPRVSAITDSFLNGGGAKDQSQVFNQANKTFVDQTTPLASNTNYDPYQTPGFRNAIDTMTSDITNNVNGQFAAAGRDGSPANSQALARGISQGIAPTIANQYNQNVSNQQGAAGNLFSANNTTGGLLSGLQQQYNANQGAGVGMIPGVTATANSGPQAALEAEAQRLGIPLGVLQGIAQIGVPIAGLGSQSTGSGTSNTTNQMSGAQQFATIGQGLGGFGKFLFG